MASASAVPSSSSSRHRTPLSVVNSGMKLRDLYAITRSDGLAQWLRRKGLIGDFTDEDCVKCNHGKMRLVKDASYSKDKACCMECRLFRKYEPREPPSRDRDDACLCHASGNYK